MQVKTKVIAIEPTTICTLRCKLCALGIPYLASPHHDTYEKICEEMRRLFQVWDYAERVDIGGGEPLCHPQLAEIVLEALKYRKQYGFLRIISNCTLLPSDELWIVMRDSRDTVGFLLDDYGAYSPCFSEIVARCEQMGISYKINTYHGEQQYCGGWIDFGGWENRRYSAEELINVYQKCHTSENPCVTVYDGKAYFCCRSMLGELLGHYTTNEKERIDLLDKKADLKWQKEIASMFGKQPPMGCQFCDGFNVDGKRYQAAEQM